MRQLEVYFFACVVVLTPNGSIGIAVLEEDNSNQDGEIIQLPIRRYVSLSVDGIQKIGWVAIISHQKIDASEHQFVYEIDLDVRRTDAISGVDLLQAFELTIKVLDAHIQRCNGQLYLDSDT